MEIKLNLNDCGYVKVIDDILKNNGECEYGLVTSYRWDLSQDQNYNFLVLNIEDKKCSKS